MSMQGRPRSLKLQELAAHTGTVNCAMIGRKTSGVLVTGGEDRKVCVYAIGKETASLSLQGHQTAVESVTFDFAEEIVIAGATSGSIKVWDLEAAKVTKSCSSHKSNVLSLGISPTGSNFLSGSMDTNVKLWDMSTGSKDAVRTFRGHTAGVTHVKYSPDNKYVASASQNGEVKIWDMSSGKLIRDLTGHTNAITGLEFNPEELILATSSLDKTIRWWDLFSFQLIASAGPEATAVRALAYGPKSGEVLFAAHQDSLRVWAMEPMVFQHDNVDVAWTKIADICVDQEKQRLVGCSFNGPYTGLWTVDLRQVQPFYTPPPLDRSSERPNAQRINSSNQAAASMPDAPVVPVHRSYRERPAAQNPVAASQPAPIAASAGRREGQVVNRRQVPELPALSNERGSGMVDQGSGEPSVSTRDRPLARQSSTPPPAPVSTSSPSVPVLQERPSGRPGMVSVAVGVGDSLRAGQMSYGEEPRVSRHSEMRNNAPARTDLPPRVRLSAASNGGQSSQQPMGSILDVPSSTANQPSAADQNAEAQNAATLAMVANIMSGHDRTVEVLRFRTSQLQVIKGFVSRGDMRGAMVAAKKSGDANIATEVLEVLREGRWSSLVLDLVPDVLDLASSALKSGVEDWVGVGIKAISRVISSFGSVISDTMSPAARVGVDLSYETRRDKCEIARNSLRSLVPLLSDSRLGGHQGAKCKEMATQIKDICP